jgi:transposase-like protein
VLKASFTCHPLSFTFNKFLYLQASKLKDALYAMHVLLICIIDKAYHKNRRCNLMKEI